ncbi:MAG: chromosomal replication initiator protein DnaA, partial [Pelagibacterales bacterium]|nr:chromosomal replication initiator protein DnaA [Pelagibacterales bacterium]
MNNKNILNKNTENFIPTKLDWSIIQAEMRNKLGNDIYESWLKKISFVDELKNYVLLSVSTRFIRDWITSRYLDQILQIIKIYKKDINRIELKINEKKNENINQISQGEISSLNGNGNVAFIKDTYLQYNTID